MMDLNWDGREVCVRLRDDVWMIGEPGTLCLTRKQALYLSAHLDALLSGYGLHDPIEPEDG